jgi:hypothetical protein
MENGAGLKIEFTKYAMSRYIWLGVKGEKNLHFLAIDNTITINTSLSFRIIRNLGIMMPEGLLKPA